MGLIMIVGITCPALYKEDYDYHLSGDCDDYCRCIINDEPCKGREIEDPEDRSSQFFSRGRCIINMEEIKKCPMYGMSKETFQTILKERTEKELNEKLNHLK